MGFSLKLHFNNMKENLCHRDPAEMKEKHFTEFLMQSIHILFLFRACSGDMRGGVTGTNILIRNMLSRLKYGVGGVRICTSPEYVPSIKFGSNLF